MTLTLSHKAFEWIKSKQGREITHYFGPFDFHVINDKLIEIKEFLNQSHLDKYQSKVTYSILVESLENVIKHSEYKGHTAAFLLAVDDNHYYVTVINPVSPETSIEVKEKFDFLYHHEIDEIKKFRHKQLKEGTISERGGAGLGLMEMIIKTNKVIELNVLDGDTDEVKLIVLNITI